MLSGLALSLILSAHAMPGLSTPGQVAPEPALYPRIRLAEYLPPITDSSRPREDAAAFVQRNGEDDLSWTSPQVEIRAHEDMSPTSLSVAFNWVWLTDTQGRRPVWFARLRAMNWTHTIERFADSRTCPGVEQSLRRFDALPTIDPGVPVLPVPGDGRAIETLGGYLHDNTYTLRLRAMFEGYQNSQRLELAGGSDSPLAPAIADTLTLLKSCWSETPPPRQ